MKNKNKENNNFVKIQKIKTKNFGNYQKIEKF